ncbi:MAG: hypothetical protein ABI422_01005 [Sphingomicrobium sp.]
MAQRLSVQRLGRQLLPDCGLRALKAGAVELRALFRSRVDPRGALVEALLHSGEAIGLPLLLLLLLLDKTVTGLAALVALDRVLDTGLDCPRLLLPLLALLNLPYGLLPCLPLDDAVLRPNAVVHRTGALHPRLGHLHLPLGASALHALLNHLHLPLGPSALLGPLLLEHLPLGPGALLNRLHLPLGTGALLHLRARLLRRRLRLPLLASAATGRGLGLRCLRLLGGLLPVLPATLGLGWSRDCHRRYRRDQNPLGHNLFPAMLHIWIEISKNRMITI